MGSIIKVAVIGGTGKSGKYLVEQLSAQGFPLKILLRNPENYQADHPNVEVVVGDARDYQAIRSLVQGCQAVISTLGQPQNEPPVCSQATTHVLRAMNEEKASRYILVSGLNVDTPSDEKGPQTQLATHWMKSNFQAPTLDRQVEYDVLSKSQQNWTLVRLPLIVLTDERKKLKTSLVDCPGEKISATDLAHFLIEQLSDERYSRKAPFIANS